MKLTGWFVSALSVLFSSSIANAGTIGAAETSLSQTGFFIGAGGSYNIIRSNANTSGTLNAISGLPPLGTFTGTTGSYTITQKNISPEVQAGYFQHISHSNWLWGAEFFYQYSQNGQTIYGEPQDPGAFINLLSPGINTRDEITFSAVQMNTHHQLALPIFLGRIFANSFIYLGGGPALIRTKLKVYSSDDTLSGYYAGTINGFSNAKWLWGGAVQGGLAYYVAPTWFLKLNYTYSVTGQYKTANSMSFSPSINEGFNTGLVAFQTSQRITAQELALSINKVFSI